MDETTKWLIGVLFGGFSAVAAYARHVATKIETGDDELHHRINQVRDEYVKRVDLDAHISRVESRLRDTREELRDDIRGVKDEIKGANARLDAVLAKLSER